ncbi:hypothetical protein NIM72_18750 [Pantoea sp. B550]|uniref:hypothetical protein n=1 Tax=Pantoea sp. B550 TaxID=2959338 RepID=UPI00209F7DC9|nr:hypothetical protein [Pantoea sp. B550]MCP1207543.1 hypothetical protein [Pantoea sp. B550]
MNTNIVQWRDPQDLQKGFVIDLQNGSAAQVLSCVYQRPIELISALSDCFLLMRYSPVEAQEMAEALYSETRSKMDSLLQGLISTPHTKFPANAAVQH